MAIVYKHTINSLSYIGVTKHTMEHRLRQHVLSAGRGEQSKFYNCINIHGAENIQSEILEECDISILFEREKYWVNHFDTFKNGLNMSRGGEYSPDRVDRTGQTNSPEHREKSSIAQKGKPKKNKGMCGKYQKSDEQKKKLAAAISGRVWVSNLETKAELQIHKEDIQKYLDDGYVLGRKARDFSKDNKNTERTPQQRKKLSEAFTGRIVIHNVELQTCLMVHQIDYDTTYKHQGYIKGRLCKPK